MGIQYLDMSIKNGYNTIQLCKMKASRLKLKQTEVFKSEINKKRSRTKNKLGVVCNISIMIYNVKSII